MPFDIGENLKIVIIKLGTLGIILIAVVTVISVIFGFLIK